MALSKALFTSNSREYETPPNFFNDLNWFYKFDVDLCASHKNHLLEDYYFQELKIVDGRARYKLRQRSFLDETNLMDKRGFKNPPYGPSEKPCSTNCTKKKCAERGWCTDVYIPGIEDFVREVSIQTQYHGRFFVVSLLPVRTGSGWWQKYIKNNPRATVNELPGRQKFLLNGKPTGTAPFDSATVLFK
jgi:DNA N-6-adenine-methyltransferase Dam